MEEDHSVGDRQLHIHAEALNKISIRLGEHCGLEIPTPFTFGPQGILDGDSHWKALEHTCLTESRLFTLVGGVDW